MMRSLGTQGIVLKRLNYGEADRIVTLLTSDYGKLRIMAKGVRRPKSKLAGGIELFSVNELHFIKGRGDIATLISSRMTRHYGYIVKELERTNAAYSMLKTVYRAVEDGAGSEYFVILHESIAALDNPKIPLHLARQSFIMRMLQGLGHVPDFTQDAKGDHLDPESHFSFDHEAVGFVHDESGPYDKNHLKVLKLLAHNSPQAMAAVQGINNFCQDLESLITNLSHQYVPQ